MATTKSAQFPNEENDSKTAVDVEITQEQTSPQQTEQTEKQQEKSEQATTVAIDFSDEDAALAADTPEFDLGEEDSEQENDTDETQDLTGLTKEQQVDLLKTLVEEKPVQIIRRDAEAIKVAFYKIHRAEIDAARKAFIESGGNQEDFVPAHDEYEQKLKDVFAEYRKKRDEYIANLEHTKEDNLTIKLKIIEDLKELVNGNETMNQTFQAFRDLQQRWKETGQVPAANVKDLWETYHLHVENFYNYIKINKELRDLDLKRNLETKTELCEEADKLVEETSVVNAFHKLQKLHELWRETGPVANEYKEAIWERFKEASSQINKRHQEYFEGLKDEQKHNLELKSELCKKAESLAEATYSSRKEWNKASDQLIEIQTIWKTIGFAPKKDNTKIYERFRNACDKFFEKKRQFYLGMKTEMDHNLDIKTALCVEAESMMDSEEWNKTSDALIALQKKWREVGPVPRRHSDAIWKRFRAACDHFFNRKSAHFSTVDTEYADNLAKKQALLAEMNECDIEAGGFERIKEFQRRWNEIGFVPIKQKEAIGKQYKEVMDKLFAIVRGGERSRQMDRFKSRINTMKGSGDRRVVSERDRLYNKVRQLESEIALLENNIGFFSKSKNAEGMIREVERKIERAKAEMAEAIEKINLIDNQE